MTKRKSFVIHIDSLDILDDLNDEQAGQLFKAIRLHQQGEDLELAPIVKIAFSPFRNQFSRDDEKYQNTCKVRAAAGSKGGKQKVANASKRKQKVANVAENKNDSKSVNDSKSKSDSEIIKDFAQKENCAAMIDQGFDIFYSAGLVKKTKKKSFDKFKVIVKTINADPVDLGELLKKDIQIRIANNQFGIDRLHPATYLNQQRWEDSHEENVNGNASRGGKQSMQDRILEASGYGRQESDQVMGGDGGDIRGAVDQGARSETISYLDSQSEQAGRVYDQDGFEANN